MPKTDMREHALLVLMTKEQRQQIAQAAAQTGIAEGAFLRMAALKEARRIAGKEAK